MTHYIASVNCYYAGLWTHVANLQIFPEMLKIGLSFKFLMPSIGFTLLTGFGFSAISLSPLKRSVGASSLES